MMAMFKVLRVQPWRKKDEQMIVMQLAVALREKPEMVTALRVGCWEVEASLRMVKYLYGEREAPYPRWKGRQCLLINSTLHRGWETLCLVPSTEQAMCGVPHPYHNPNIWEMEVRRSRVQGYLHLYKKVKTSLGCILCW